MDKEITVVTGLPRSGTSLVMQMLEAGGMAVLQDGIRQPDIDNPKGYYEFERVKRLPEDDAWIPDAVGKVVKINGSPVTQLPPGSKHGLRYRVIFIERDIKEVAASQGKMIKRLNNEETEVNLESLMSRLLTKMQAHILSRTDTDTDIMFLNYNQLMKNPKVWISALNRFMGKRLDMGKMLAVIDRNLYRNKV